MLNRLILKPALPLCLLSSLLFSPLAAVHSADLPSLDTLPLYPLQPVEPGRDHLYPAITGNNSIILQPSFISDGTEYGLRLPFRTGSGRWHFGAGAFSLPVNAAGNRTSHASATSSVYIGSGFSAGLSAGWFTRGLPARAADGSLVMTPGLQYRLPFFKTPQGRPALSLAAGHGLGADGTFAVLPRSMLSFYSFSFSFLRIYHEAHFEYNNGRLDHTLLTSLQTGHFSLGGGTVYRQGSWYFRSGLAFHSGPQPENVRLMAGVEFKTLKNLRYEAGLQSGVVFTKPAGRQVSFNLSDQNLPADHSRYLSLYLEGAGHDWMLELNPGDAESDDAYRALYTPHRPEYITGFYEDLANLFSRAPADQQVVTLFAADNRRPDFLVRQDSYELRLLVRSDSGLPWQRRQLFTMTEVQQLKQGEIESSRYWDSDRKEYRHRRTLEVPAGTALQLKGFSLPEQKKEEQPRETVKIELPDHPVYILARGNGYSFSAQAANLEEYVSPFAALLPYIATQTSSQKALEFTVYIEEPEQKKNSPEEKTAGPGPQLKCRAAFYDQDDNLAVALPLKCTAGRQKTAWPATTPLPDGRYRYRLEQYRLNEDGDVLLSRKGPGFELYIDNSHPSGQISFDTESWVDPARNPLPALKATHTEQFFCTSYRLTLLEAYRGLDGSSVERTFDTRSGDGCPDSFRHSGRDRYGNTPAPGARLRARLELFDWLGQKSVSYSSPVRVEPSWQNHGDSWQVEFPGWHEEMLSDPSTFYLLEDLQFFWHKYNGVKELRVHAWYGDDASPGTMHTSEFLAREMFSVIGGQLPDRFRGAGTTRPTLPLVSQPAYKEDYRQFRNRRISIILRKERQ